MKKQQPKQQQKPNTEDIEDIIVDIANRLGSRVKQKNCKSFSDVHHIFCDVNDRSIQVAKAIHKNGNTTKDVQSKLKEVAITCILGIEWLNNDV